MLSLLFFSAPTIITRVFPNFHSFVRYFYQKLNFLSFKRLFFACSVELFRQANEKYSFYFDFAMNFSFPF